MSEGYKVEVIADSSGKWLRHGLVFPSVSEAEVYARAVRAVIAVREWRVVDSKMNVVKSS